MALPEVLIIGGGIAGLSGALALSRRGVSVAVADSRTFSGSASCSGGGILSPLPPWSAVRAVQDLAHRGAEMFPAWLDSMGAETAAICGHERRGMLAVWPCCSVGDFSAWRERGGQAELVRARDFAPGLCFPEEVDEGDSAWLPDVRQIHPQRVLEVLENKLRELRNVSFMADSVLGFRDDGRRILSAHLSGGEEIQAGCFVLSAGAWSGSLSPLPCPDIRPLRGHMALYRAEESVLRELGIILFGDGLYLIPRGDGTLLAGGGMEDSGFDAGIGAEMAGRIRSRAEGLFGGKLGNPERMWTGLRPASPGNIPVVERHRLRENLYFHTGHFRYGLTMAPATAERLAEMICGGS